MPKKITLAATAAAYLLAASLAQAASLAVTNGNDSGPGSLRQTLLDASLSGDTIIFLGGVTQVALQSQLVIDKNVTINGPSVTLDGQLKGRVVLVQAGATVTLQGLTITHGLLAGKGIDAGGTADSGSSWGAGIRNDGTLTLDGVQVLGNYATGGGGGGGSGIGGGGGGGSGAGLNIGQPGEIKGAGGNGGSGSSPPSGGGSGATDIPMGGGGIFPGGNGSNGGGAGGGGHTGGGGGGGGGWAGGGGGGGLIGAGGGGYGGGGGDGNAAPGGGSSGGSGGAAGDSYAGNGGAGSAGGAGSSLTGGTYGGGGGYATFGYVWVGGGGGSGKAGLLSGGSAGGAAAGGIYNAPGAQLTVKGAGCLISANLAAGGGGSPASTAGGQAVGGLWNDGQLSFANGCESTVIGNAAGAGMRGKSAGFDRAEADLRDDKLLQVAVLSSGGRVSATAPPAPTAGQIANCTLTSGACQASYFAGGVVTLTATPNTGLHLQAWGGDCTGNATTCTVTMSQARSVTASFAVNTYAISASASPAEGGSITCPASANHGSTATCTASAPNVDFTFTGFTGCTSVTASTCTLSNVTGPRTVVAQYAAIASINGTTVPASGTGGPASASIGNGGGPLCRFDPTATGFVAASATPAGKVAPQGALRFKLVGCTPGATVRVTTVWPQPVADFTKYSQGAFLPLSHFTLSGNTVSFDVTDGGLGDDDGLQNGEIVDPAMPLAAAAPASAQGIPTLNEWGLLLLSALLGLWGMRGMRAPVRPMHRSPPPGP